MLRWFLFAFNCVCPILLLVLLGYVLRRKNILTDEFLTTGNHFVFHYCISAMLFKNVYDLESLGDIPWTEILFVTCILIFLSFIGLAAGFLCTDVHERRGVIAQTWVRSNSAIIGIPLAEAIGGESALSMLAPLQIPAISIYNGVSVIFLTLFSRDTKKKVSFWRILTGILKNPLIRALLLGMVCLAVRGTLPKGADGRPVFSLRSTLPALYTAIGYLGRIATPLALVILGGRFSFGAVKGMRKEIVTTTLGRLVIAPAIAFTLVRLGESAGLFTITPDLCAALIPIFASPLSVSAAPMAAEMNADDVLAGQLVVWTCIGSMFTLFFIIVLFQAIGWL